MGVCCLVCEKVFSSQSNLNKHKRLVHQINHFDPLEYDYDVGLFKCLNGCNISFKFNTDLRKHLEENHNIQSHVIEKKFSSYEEVMSWLKIEEHNNDVRYQKSTGTKRNSETEKFYYNCVRSGKQRTVSDQILKRSTKSQGTSKINSNCTSQIIITKNTNGECLITYYKNHYGHGQDIQHLKISKATREGVACKLKLGVSSDHIVDSIRDNITLQLKRDDLLTKEDIKNIKKSYNIQLKDGYRHTNDAISVYLWVKELSETESTPILFYKRQDELSSVYSNLRKEDFCLIWMNTTQADLLNKFGENVICLDSTHGLNPYDFELTTILVIDEFGEGFPTAFMFSNRKDTYIFEIFFKQVKTVVGNINPKFFMSDMTNVFSNAWQNVMGSVEKILFCAWHIDRAWQQNLNKVSDKDARSWVYKSLKYLQNISDETEFDRLFQNFLNILKEKSETKTMFQYIQTYYLNNTHKWAFCYRKGTKINTNMHLKSMHKVIKYIYLDGKKVRRLDKSLNALQKFIRNKIIDRIIKLTKGKSTEHLCTIHARHRIASIKNFKIEQMSENCSYLLESEDEDHTKYIINRQHQSMCCQLSCKYCQICVHMFECSCTDYNIKHTICVHIHYICLNFLTMPSCSNYNLKRKEEEVNKLVQTVSCDKKEQSYDTMVAEVQSLALKVFEDVGNKPQSMNELKLIMQNLKSAALLSSKMDDYSDGLVFNSNKENTEPSNKKIEKQIFFSTKKKTSKKAINIKKPTEDEKRVIQEYLNESLCLSNDPANDHLYVGFQ